MISDQACKRYTQKHKPVLRLAEGTWHRWWLAQADDLYLHWLEPAEGQASLLLDSPWKGSAQADKPLLLCLQLAEGQAVYQLLDSPWRELWLTWLDEGDTTHKQHAADRKQDRKTFIQTLVASHIASTREGRAARAGQAQEESAAAEAAANGLPDGPVAVFEQSPEQQRQSRRMQEALAAFRASAEGRQWQEARGKLPVTAIRAGLLEALQEKDFAVVSGDTGCGKTTQVHSLPYLTHCQVCITGSELLGALLPL